MAPSLVARTFLVATEDELGPNGDVYTALVSALCPPATTITTTTIEITTTTETTATTNGTVSEAVADEETKSYVWLIALVVAVVLIIVAIVIWLCCCRNRQDENDDEPARGTFVRLLLVPSRADMWVWRVRNAYTCLDKLVNGAARPCAVCWAAVTRRRLHHKGWSHLAKRLALTCLKGTSALSSSHNPQYEHTHLHKHEHTLHPNTCRTQHKRKTQNTKHHTKHITHNTQHTTHNAQRTNAQPRNRANTGLECSSFNVDATESNVWVVRAASKEGSATRVEDAPCR
jgi:uncharacterized membrane protein YhaH (DUF805 family)